MNLTLLRTLSLGVAGALLLSACAGLGPRLQAPRLSLVGVEVQEGAGLFEQRLNVRLRAQNPNDREIPVRGITLDFELGGQQLATGVSGQQFTVPAFGEAEFDVLVSANMAGVLLKLFSEREKLGDDIEYEMSGKVSTSLGLLRSIPFRERGTLPLKSLGLPKN